MNDIPENDSNYFKEMDRLRQSVERMEKSSKVIPWGKDKMVHVFRMPNVVPAGFVFNPKPVEFLYCDWFSMLPDGSLDTITKFIKGKVYYNPEYRYIAVCDDGRSIIVEGSK